MSGRAWIVVALAAVVLMGARDVAAQTGSARELARELARLAIDDSVRRGVDEQITGGLMQVMSATLQERLSRRLLDVEWRLLSDIVGRFVRETLPPGRTDEIAAQIYLRHFDEGELRELVAFQRSAVGRKAARLARVVSADTMRAIDADVRSSPAMPAMLAELHRAFPVLGPYQSP